MLVLGGSNGYTPIDSHYEGEPFWSNKLHVFSFWRLPLLISVHYLFHVHIPWSSFNFKYMVQVITTTHYFDVKQQTGAFN